MIDIRKVIKYWIIRVTAYPIFYKEETDLEVLSDPMQVVDGWYYPVKFNYRRWTHRLIDYVVTVNRPTDGFEYVIKCAKELNIGYDKPY